MASKRGKITVHPTGPRYPHPIGSLVRGADCAGREFEQVVTAHRGPWMVVLDGYISTPVGLITENLGVQSGRRPASPPAKKPSRRALAKSRDVDESRRPRQQRLPLGD